uniref:RILP-like protein 1 n=1 Tax=Heterorhabditis bacteriophora TaxID=37862 RepID=A0A1I7XSE6_HETBA
MSLPLVQEYEEFVAENISESSLGHSMALRGPSPQSPSKHITVVDVYDLAASIGKDFEKLIELHGSESIRGIMPKVISALETLESLANNNERENEQILALQKTVERLEHEKQAKQQQSAKFEEELDQVEETYKRDINELRVMVKTLMSENKSLSTTVSSFPPLMDSPSTIAMREEDIKLMFELKEMSHKQKEEIKTLQKDVDSYVYEVENLQNSIEKLIRQNEELLRKNSSLQKQGRIIVEEKMEILRRLEKTEEANIHLRKMLTDTNRACKDLQQATLVDDEPRFTLAELREVLQEKNILKGRLMELEEELENIRPGSKKEQGDDEDQTSEPLHPYDGDDPPVYGPLPKEPDEKLYPWKYERKDSGVRKFFRFFKDLGVTASPRRGSSTNSSPCPQRAPLAGQLIAF